MTAYVIMERGQQTSGASDAVFIRDGFAAFAFIAPVIWLLWHRLWVAAALALGASLLIAGLAEDNPLWSLLCLPLALYIGLEGQALRIRRLGRNGWRDVAVIEGRSLAEAEIRYFTACAAPAPLADGR